MDNFDELMNLQRQMASRIVQESDDDLKLKVMDIVNEFAGSGNKQVQVEQVIVEASIQGIQEDDTLNVLEDLIDIGFLTRPEDGFVKRS
jgi:uncharacterized membrane protein